MGGLIETTGAPVRGLPPRDAARGPAAPCRAALLEILFEGRAPSEGRIEALLDRLEAAR